jgi:hypothetical protein
VAITHRSGWINHNLYFIDFLKNLNTTQQQPRTTVRKWNKEQILPCDTRVKVTVVARPLFTPVAQKLCRCEHGVFTIRTCVHSRTLLLIAVFSNVRETFSNPYPDKEVPKKTIIHRLVTTFRNTGSVCDRGCWFQHDGATAHTANTTAVLLQEFFGELIIGSCLWPPRSPDLTPPNFFPGGFLK